MTRIRDLILTVCLVAIASGSCAAPPTGIRNGAAPEFRTPAQVPSVAIAADSVGYAIVKSGGTLTLFSVNGSVVTKIQAMVFDLDGPTPTPTPNPPLPPQPPPLTARQAMFRDVALTVAEPARADTARNLAFDYLNIATTPYPDALALSGAVHNATVAAIPLTAVQAWQPFRDSITNEWNQQSRLPAPDYLSVLRDASKGLTASVTP